MGPVAGADAREAKRASLYRGLRKLPSLIVAYSGGVDSAYLAYAATEVLAERALCITADRPSYPAHHRAMAIRLAREFNFHPRIISTAEIDRAVVMAEEVETRAAAGGGLWW